jgi:hypothetical protein
MPPESRPGGDPSQGIRLVMNSFCLILQLSCSLKTIDVCTNEKEIIKDV